MKKFAQILGFAFVLLLILLPFISSADLITCGGPTDSKMCDFNSFIGTLNFIIEWLIKIAVVIFTLTLVWGGYLYVTSGANPGNKDKAKKVLWNTFLGFIIMISAWLIVHTLLKMLVGADGQAVFKYIGN